MAAVIARVRIAPIERWCEGGKRLASQAIRDRAGSFVAIDTASMWVMTSESGEPFKNWRLVGEDLAWLLREDDADSLCQHMLEMD